jgi:hypothetical protein
MGTGGMSSPNATGAMNQGTAGNHMGTTGTGTKGSRGTNAGTAGGPTSLSGTGSSMDGGQKPADTGKH